MKRKDLRLTLLDQPRRHGPGFVDQIGASLPGSYFISMDDDVLPHSRQRAKVFECLLAQPDVPHGIAVSRGGVYVQNRGAEVDELYLPYAVTREHVPRYLKLTWRLLATGEVRQEDVELWSDDIVLSACGKGKLRIHKVGFFLQNKTCFSERIAIHKAADFEARRRKARATLQRLLKQEQLAATGKPDSLRARTCGQTGVSQSGCLTSVTDEPLPT